MTIKKLFLISSLLVVILLASQVHAVGIGGPQLIYSLDYESGLVKTFPYQISSTSNRVMDYNPYAKGDLAPYMRFIPEKLPLAPGESAWFNAVLRLPKDKTLLEPGIHEIRIGVTEQALNNENIGAVTGVTVPIRVRVLYPEPTLRASMLAHDTSINEPAPVDISLSNWGEKPITSAYAIITVLDDNNQTLDTITTEAISVPSSKSKTISTVIDTFGYKPGSYIAQVTIIWDLGEEQLQDTFRVGIADVKITAYTTRVFADQINPFSVDIESVWNNPLSNVYAIIDLNGQKLQTPTYSLSAFEKKRLVTYFDAAGVSLGNYNGEMILFYGGNSKKKSISVRVIEGQSNQEEVIIQEPTSTSSPIVTFIIIVITLNIVIWIYLFIKKREEEE